MKNLCTLFGLLFRRNKSKQPTNMAFLTIAANLIFNTKPHPVFGLELLNIMRSSLCCAQWLQYISAYSSTVLSLCLKNKIKIMFVICVRCSHLLALKLSYGPFTGVTICFHAPVSWGYMLNYTFRRARKRDVLTNSAYEYAIDMMRRCMFEIYLSGWLCLEQKQKIYHILCTVAAVILLLCYYGNRMPAMSSVLLAEGEIIGHDPLSSILVFWGRERGLYVSTYICV